MLVAAERSFGVSPRLQRRVIGVLSSFDLQRMVGQGDERRYRERPFFPREKKKSGWRIRGSASRRIAHPL